MDSCTALAMALSLVTGLYAFRCARYRADSGKNFAADLGVMIGTYALFANLAWMEIF